MMVLPPRRRQELNLAVSLPLPGLLRCILVLVIAVRPSTASIFSDCGPSPSSPVKDGDVCIFQLELPIIGVLQSSWDAGVIDGALHLTTDDVYQPPVYYPPDPKRRAGCAILLEEVILWQPVRKPSDINFKWQWPWRATYASLARSRTTFPDGRRVAIEVSQAEYYYSQGTTSMYVSIEPEPNTTSMAIYTVWIDYNATAHNLSVYVVEGGKPKPGEPTLHMPLNVTDVVRSPQGASGYFGLFASKSRFLPTCQAVVYSWNITMEKLPPEPMLPEPVPEPMPREPNHGRELQREFFAILLTVVLPIAVITAVVFMAACYFSSRYRALRTRLKLSEVLRQLPGVPREFKHATIRKATHNFHEMMKLGRGGFGAVYKGTLRSGKRGEGRVDVAVKKFTRKDDRGYEDFLAEVDIIHRLRHKNIVPLLGWSYENGELLLIYEYMPNGSVDKHLFHEKQQHRGHQQPVLPWERRYDIVKDVAAGLHYVHHEYERTVLHRDIKASNIMLDSAFRGRLGDFGLARVVAFDKNSFTDIGVAGTWGFIAPEYPVSHKATRQTDVYAFGVLVLEVVTGRRSLGKADDEFPMLVDWVWWLHQEGRLLEAVDAELRSSEAEFDAGDAARAAGCHEDGTAAGRAAGEARVCVAAGGGVTGRRRG
uniref:Putative LRR receptor-like serine/threonine-protein kinase n=1 Tax=Aegilops tauschii TaxID=37682 RepID=M8AM75_AEGTA